MPHLRNFCMMYYTSRHAKLQAATMTKFGIKCKQSVNSPSLFTPHLPTDGGLWYTVFILPDRSEVFVSSRSKRRKDVKQMAIRVISLALAVLMVLSVVMATVWQW